MSEDTATPATRSRARVAAVVVTVIAVVIAGGLWFRSTLAVPQADGEAAPGVLRLDPATSAGDDPFTASVVSPEHDAGAVLTEVIVARTVAITQDTATDGTTGAAQVAATAPGLYGGSGRLSSCEPQALTDFLAADAAKAAAWAGVLGISVESIPAFVAGLTSVVLTMDTLVTNHGFEAGVATAHPSLLQAGTAVLVDARGLPVVRCACGNPLLPAQLTAALAEVELVGSAWDGLDLQRVVTVTPAAEDVSAFTVADLSSGELVDLPVGAGLAPDVYVATSSNHAQTAYEPEPYRGTLQTSPDGVTWTVALETTPMLDVATGGGLAVAVGLDAQSGGAIHTSTDGETWTPAIGVVDPLTAVTYGDGTWIAVGNRSFAEEGGEGDGSSGAIYRSEDAVTWERVATTDPYENSELAGSGEMLYQSMTSVAYGHGRWIAGATECAYRTCMRVLFTSDDAVIWTRTALDDRIVRVDLAHDGEEWAFVGGTAKPDPANNAEIDFPIGAAGTSPDGVTWSVGATSPEGLVLTGLNPGGGAWLAVDAYVPASADAAPPGGGVHRSTDLLTWERIGTADPWTTSVALLRTGAAAPAAAPVGQVDADADADADSVRIRTAGLELLAADGTTAQTLPFQESAAAAIEAVTGLLGASFSELTPGDGYCSADRTRVTWGALWLTHEGTDAAASGWWVGLDSDVAGVTGPDGVTVGQSVADVRAAHPEAPSESYGYEGVQYDLVYLDVTSTDGGTEDMAVEVVGEDGVVVGLRAPVYVMGDC
ncbi:hypothetical protein FH969_06495 [Miniimonas arenae]|uniref:DUF6777 domain-containing protein n=1 Tax=Miniimonas arenae TaxID=676201 RepID=A0A5C5BCX5_9MICO|nr:DUF6777 domain-containing protein [Miniimonas arenae]TNU74967.1 hypothetical protein FH969_06495 [Miniimonas arenae]